MPSARFWTLTVTDATGHLVVSDGPPRRAGFTSSEIVRDAKGDFVIRLAREARAGNWLPLVGAGSFHAGAAPLRFAPQSQRGRARRLGDAKDFAGALRVMKQKRFLSRPLEALTWLAAVLCVAGVVHLSTILSCRALRPTILCADRCAGAGQQARAAARARTGT